MLWLDSAFPLDKPATDPGIQRGPCIGGEESTPAYLRQTWTDGFVAFQNAFVGPIGSFLNTPTPAPTPGGTPARRRTSTPSRRRGGGGGGGCCRFQADCGDCGEDGTGWCHMSSSNCAVCTGTFDPSGPTPCCGGGCPAPTPAPPPPTPSQPCTDNNQNCAGWAAGGECARNPDYMLTNCRLSCGACPQPTPAPTPRPTPAPPPPSPVPSPPPVGATGLCCFQGGCGVGTCDGGFCGSSQGNCEGVCSGEFWSAPTPAPAPVGPGVCCFLGGCADGQCDGGFCGSSQGNCEGTCGGAFWFRPAAGLASLKNTKKHV